MSRPTWQAAQHLLKDFDGTVTEIIMDDLPLSQLSSVISVLSKLPSLEVLTFEDETLEISERFNPVWHTKLESLPSSSCEHALRSASDSEHHLQIYLWIHCEKKSLALNFVFWNDLTFPSGLTEAQYEMRLQTLCALVEECRAESPGARCVLTREHNGPASVLVDSPEVIWW